MSELSVGVRIVLARMETNPDEFFGGAPKWSFIFKGNFLEVMTEPEKGAIHEKLKEVRRKEFDALAMRTLMEDDMRGQILSGQGFAGQGMLSDGNIAYFKNGPSQSEYPHNRL